MSHIMYQCFVGGQHIRIVDAPACLIEPKFNQLKGSFGSNVEVQAHCVRVTGTTSRAPKKTSASCVRNVSLWPGLWRVKSGETNLRNKQHTRRGCEEERSSFGRAGSTSREFSRTAHSDQFSGESQPAIQSKAYTEESNGDTSTSLPRVSHWLSQDFGLSPYDFKLWFRSVCSTVLALTICVPQALGAGAVLGDLALNNCENPEIDYAPLKGLEGTPLKGKLHNLIKDHKVYTYLQAWDALKDLDEAKDDPDSVGSSS